MPSLEVALRNFWLRNVELRELRFKKCFGFESRESREILSFKSFEMLGFELEVSRKTETPKNTLSALYGASLPR